MRSNACQRTSRPALANAVTWQVLLCKSLCPAAQGSVTSVAHAFDRVQRGAVSSDAAADDHQVIVVLLAAMTRCPHCDRLPRGS